VTDIKQAAEELVSALPLLIVKEAGNAIPVITQALTKYGDQRFNEGAELGIDKGYQYAKGVEAGLAEVWKKVEKIVRLWEDMDVGIPGSTFENEWLAQYGEVSLIGAIKHEQAKEEETIQQREPNRAI